MSIISAPIVTSSSIIRTFAFRDVVPLADNMSHGPEFKNIVNRLRDKPIPDDAKAKASMYAPQLVATMRENVRRLARHQTAGSLDTSKLVRLARPFSPAQFERDAATAFRARAQVTNNVPLKIAIVADMCWDNRCYDSTYAERVGTLSYIVGDAAACAGLQCQTIGVRGTIDKTYAYYAFDDATIAQAKATHKKLSLISILSDFGKRAAPIDFNFHTDDQGYIGGAYGALMGSGHDGHVPGSKDGTGGIDYAREIGGATFVVGFGEFQDRSRPDVQLPSSTPLDEAVRAIHAALADRQRRAA